MENKSGAEREDKKILKALCLVLTRNQIKKFNNEDKGVGANTREEINEILKTHHDNPPGDTVGLTKQYEKLKKMLHGRGCTVTSKHISKHVTNSIGENAEKRPEQRWSLHRLPAGRSKECT